MPRARLSPAGVLLAAALTLVGCGGDKDVDVDSVDRPAPSADPTVSVDDAQSTWAPVADELATAVGTVADGPGRPDGRSETIYYDGDLERCAYASLRYEFDAVFGNDPAWDDVRRTVGEVLEPQGFEVSEQLTIPGGQNGFDAYRDDGTTVEVRSKTGDPSTVFLVAPLTGSCDREVSETLTPLPDPVS